MEASSIQGTRWSWRFATIRGIAVYVHTTLLLLLAGILVFQVSSDNGIAGAISAALTVILIFACVLAHEFGHALTALHFGVRTCDITLYPLGGVARLEGPLREPYQELVVALVGPAVNLAIFAGLLAVQIATATTAGSEAILLMDADMLGTLTRVNLVLALFNLLPAFPMDGGRVLRALLARRMDYLRATETAARLGQVIALLFGLAGLLFSPMLLIIALFVYLGAGEETELVRAELTSASDRCGRNLWKPRRISVGSRKYCAQNCHGRAAPDRARCVCETRNSDHRRQKRA